MSNGLSRLQQTEARLLAVSEMLEHHLATGEVANSPAVLLLQARRAALRCEQNYDRLVESLAGFKRGLVRPGRSGEPFTADDLNGWTPPVPTSGFPESESQHGG